MLIEITRRGVYRSTGDMVQVGEQVEVPDGFTGWANKYRVISQGKGKSFEVATPTVEERPDGSHPGEKIGGFKDSDLDQLRAEYEDRFGEKPHGRMKADTLREKLAGGQ